MDRHDSHQIQAAVHRGVGEPTSIENLTISSAGPGEVRVAVSACAICHSDLMYVDGGWATSFHLVLGHEVSGRVVEIGEDVSNVTVGTPVVVSLIRTCGQCRPCLKGQDVACEGEISLDAKSPLKDKDGLVISQGLNTGGFAEQVLVHHSQVVEIPEEMPLSVASLLGCGVLTGVGATRNTAEVGEGDIVVVIGCGGVGIGAIQGARLAGAEVILAVDPEDHKHGTAIEMGATHTANPKIDNVVEVLNGAAGGRLADHVFVATSSISALSEAVELVSPMGALVLVGMPADGATFTIDPGMLAAQNQRILGSKMGTARLSIDVPDLIDNYLIGELTLDSMISSTHPLEDIDKAFEEVRTGQALRTLIVFNDASLGGNS